MSAASVGTQRHKVLCTRTRRETEPPFGLCEINCLPWDNISGTDLKIAQTEYAGRECLLHTEDTYNV